MKPLACVSAPVLAAGLCTAGIADAQTRQDAARTGPVGGVSSAEYVKKSAVSDQFEIEAGKLALQKAQDPAVKSFAQKMVDEHTRASEKLKQAAVSAKLNAAPPRELD